MYHMHGPLERDTVHTIKAPNHLKRAPGDALPVLLVDAIEQHDGSQVLPMDLSTEESGRRRSIVLELVRLSDDLYPSIAKGRLNSTMSFRLNAQALCQLKLLFL